MVAWPNLTASLAFGLDSSSCTTDQYLNVWGLGVYDTDVDTYTTFFNEFAEFSAAHPTYSGSFVIDRYGSQKVASIPENNTAYPYRTIKSHMYVLDELFLSSTTDCIL